jgi:hypothetical protein
LHYVVRHIVPASQPLRVPNEPDMPDANQLGHCIALASLGAEDEQLSQYLARSICHGF